MSFPPYPKYKDSGVEWLDELPNDWAITKLKWISKLYSGGTPDKTRPEFWENGTIPWLSSGEVNQVLVRFPTTFITDEAFRNSSAKWVPKNALLIALAGQGKTKGMVAQLAFPSTCNQSMAAIVLDEGVESRFLFWWLSGNYQNIRNLAGGDLRDGLNLELLGNIDCPAPSTDEADLIARTLDQETAKIDALIEEQKRLIELLKEKRQAVISHAVIKGLDPSVGQKESGTDWFDTVPNGWQIKKFSQIAQIVRGGSPRPAGDTRYFDGSFIPWITVGEVTKDDGILLTETETMLTEDGSKLSRQIQAGTLIMTNSGATLGVPKVLAISGCANDGVLAFLNVSQELDQQFIYHFLSSLTEPLRERVKQGSGQPNLNTAIVGALPIPIPPLEEQKQIVSFLSGQLAAFDDLQAKSLALVDLLRERRSALISAAVTGKIDVRQPLRKPVASVKPYNSGFAHQLLAATILGKCNDKHMGRVKLQKLIHVTEYHAQIEDLKGEYTRQLAGPLDMKAMAGLERGLEKQHWYKTVREGQRYRYQPLEKKDQHQKYLDQWTDKQVRIEEVLVLMGGMNMRQCEIVSTLYAAWNDLLIDGLPATEDAILDQAATAEGWHESKERTPRDKWVSALQWMRQHALIPTGFGSHTSKASPEGIHELT